MVKRKVLQFDYNALEKCVLDTDNKALEQISDAIARAGKVYIVGCGAASGVVKTGAALFMMLGIPAFSVGDAMLRLRSAVFLNPEDVLIALCTHVLSRQAYLFVITGILSGNVYAVGFGHPVGWILCALVITAYYCFSRWDA